MRKLHLLFTVAVASQLGATNCGEILRDPGFDLWCGDGLCAWKVERGEVKRVPTWHEGDSGVELVGTDVAIEQLSPVDSSDGYCTHDDAGTHCEYPADVCIEFSLLANVDKDAAVDLNVDVFGDGTIDHMERLPTGTWQSLSYRIVVKKPFAGIRFEIAKAGAGTAQLANIGARVASDCEGLPVITPRPIPVGSPCEEDADCGSGMCVQTQLQVPFPGVWGFIGTPKVCDGCTLQSCSGGQVCGLAPPVSPVRAPAASCTTPGIRQVGEQCNTDPECGSGKCVYNVCSSCDPFVTTTGCASGETCGPAWDGSAPNVCSPHGHLRGTGETCANHDDCASGVCNGAERRQCTDGRACIDASQCPFEDGLKNGPCTTVGIQGGTCG